MFKNYFIAATLIGLLGSSCATQTPPTSGLYEKGTHTGTLTVLRVEDNWIPDEPIEENGQTVGWKSASTGRCSLYLADDKSVVVPEPTTVESKTSPNKLTEEDVNAGAEEDCTNPLRRFVPLRHKDEISGMGISEDEIVDDTEDVTLTLNYAFVRYFKEGINSQGDLFQSLKKKTSPKGEIAMILSFDSGEAIKQSFLVYASQGQTFGSFLDFQDWVVAGPVKIKASNLSVRMVIIEMDQAENEKTKNFIRGLAQVASVVAPGISQAVPIATPIAETLVSQNGDDVVFDQRFTLKRMIQGEKVQRGALLYGKYVAVSQEDSLAANSARDKASSSIIPVDVPRLRYDVAADRLFKVYPYHPIIYRRKQANKSESENQSNPYEFAPIERRWGPISVSDPLTLEDTKNDDCLYNSAMEDQLNNSVAMYRRKNILGFKRDGGLNTIDTECTQEEAFGRIAWEFARLTRKGKSKGKTFLQRLDPSLFNDNDEYIFPYTILDYPQAYTLAAQYAQHTHFVFSIEESVGHAGQAYHERFPKYSEFLNQEIQQAKDDTQISALADNFVAAIKSQKKTDATMAWLRANRGAPKEEQLCRLFNSLEKSDSSAVTANGYLLNKLSGVADTYFSSTKEVFDYLKSDYSKTLEATFVARTSADEAIGNCKVKDP